MPKVETTAIDVCLSDLILLIIFKIHDPLPNPEPG